MAPEPSGSAKVATGEKIPAGGSGIRLRSAFLVSSTGDWIYRFAVPTLILRITGSALATAFAYVLEFIPYVIAGPMAGVVADRWNRRRILIMCDTGSTGITLTIAGITTLHHLPLAVLYGCALLLACVRPLYFPAFQGLLVDTIPGRDRAGLNAWTQTVDSALNMMGPVAGTAIVAAAGVSLATLINALSFACSAILIYQLAYIHRPAVSQGTAPAATTLGGVRRDFAEGIRLLWQNKAIRYGTGLMAVANLAGSIIEANLIFLVVRTEGLPKIVFGVIFGAQGLGAVVGAIFATRLAGRYPTGRLLVYGMGGSAAAMLLPALAPHWWMMIASCGAEGIVTSVIVVSWFTERQRIVPPGAIGRVVSVSRAIAYVAIPLGALLGGWLAGNADPVREVFGVAAALQAAVFLGTALSPVARMNAGHAAIGCPNLAEDFSGHPPDPLDSAADRAKGM
jgi:MFS family permease